MNGAIQKSEIGLLLLLTAGVQSLFANYFPAALYLDLSLVLTLYVGWHSSPVEGAGCGVSFGWIQDAISGIFLGLNGLSKTLLGFGGSYLSKWLMLDTLLSKCVMLAGLCVVDNVVVVGMGTLLGQPVLQSVWLRSAIEVPVTGIVGALIFEIYDRFKFPSKDFRRL